MQKVFAESPRLLVRRPELGDEQHLERIFGDAAMMRYLGGAWPPEEVRDVLLEWRDGWGDRNRWHGVLVLKDSLEPIGTAGIAEDTVPDEDGVELSWFVLPEYQRQGLAAEISRELLRLAFVDLNADRVIAETHPESPAATALLKKLYFSCLGERQHEYEGLAGFDTQALWELRRSRWLDMSEAPTQCAEAPRSKDVGSD